MINRNIIVMTTKPIAGMKRCVLVNAIDANPSTARRSHALSMTNSDTTSFFLQPKIEKYLTRTNSPSFPGVAVNANPAK